MTGFEGQRPGGTSLVPPPPPSADARLNTTFAGPRANHMGEADKAMNLTTQEQFLYNHHLKNLNGTGKVVNEDGSISTLRQMSFERDGKTYNVPTIWGGKILEPDDAIKVAEKVGLDKFPSYKSEDAAESRYQAMHDYLEKDTGDFIAAAKSK